MRKLQPAIRELRLLVRDKTALLWFAIVLGLASLSLGFGISETERQNQTIQQLLVLDQQERTGVSKKLHDWGSAAYYTFHLTYDPPSDFAFAALGQRDAQPWKHRIRMLALEGQIYERDAKNPTIALIGRFDFAFLSAFIVPLVLIMLLYDTRSSERTAGRCNLLEATAGNPLQLWVLRTSLRAGAVLLCLLVPLFVCGAIVGTEPATLLLAALYTCLYVVLWAGICFYISSLKASGTVVLMSLVSLWILTSVVVPATARLAIDSLVPLPSGADILMTQREAVNDAWDLPRNVTMDAFFARHPQWSNYEPQKSSFEWQWYYAFQQVGDQHAEELATAHREGRLQRSTIASYIAVLTPPTLLENALQSLAKTDIQASIRYEEKVRAYHAELRAFYYPKFFMHEPFDKKELSKLPLYK